MSGYTARLHVGGDDVLSLDLVQKRPGRSRCRTGQDPPGDLRVGWVVNAEMAGTGQQRMLPRRVLLLPPLTLGVLLGVLFQGSRAPHVGNGWGQGSEIGARQHRGP